MTLTLTSNLDTRLDALKNEVCRSRHWKVGARTKQTDRQERTH